MGTYLLNFIVYTMAMVGLLLVGVMVYKKTMFGNNSAQNAKGLKVENALSLSPRKTLYIVKAGMERFLIAADTERTTFLAKLSANTQEAALSEAMTTVEVEPLKNFKQTFNASGELKEQKVAAAYDTQGYTKEQSYVEADNAHEIKKKTSAVDYSEVMKALEGNSVNVKRPVMRELLRKLNENTALKAD